MTKQRTQFSCSYLQTPQKVKESLTSFATSDVLRSDVMFLEKFLMSDVLTTNLMLTGLLLLFTTFPLISG